jgi:hypothetical protein
MAVSALHSQRSNDGMIANHNANVQQAVFRNGAPAPAGWTHWKDRNTRGKVGTAAPSAPTAPQAPFAATGGAPQQLSYQSGINVGGGIGKRGVLSGLISTGNHSDPNVAAFARATALNDATQIGRGIDAQNLDLQMAQQAKRSESTTAGASNLAKIHGDYAERQNSQIGLAAQIAANNIGFAAGLTPVSPYGAYGYGGFR